VGPRGGVQQLLAALSAACSVLLTALSAAQVGPAGRARAAPRSWSRCMAEGGGAPGHVVLLLAPHQQQPLRLWQPSLQHQHQHSVICTLPGESAFHRHLPNYCPRSSGHRRRDRARAAHVLHSPPPPSSSAS
jgi:hypothetical protein